MKPLVLAALLSFLCFSVGASSPFSATLFAPSVQRLGDEVTCQVVITNNDDMDYLILKRGTPLEGLKSDMFSIMKDSVASNLPYDGFHFKRASPTEEDYFLIPKQSSVSSDLVLSQAYGLYDPSFYSIKLSTELQYTDSLQNAMKSQDLSSNTDHFLLLDNGRLPQLTEPEFLKIEEALIERHQSSPGLTDLQSDGDKCKPPEFSGSWPDNDKSATKKAYYRAFNVAGESSTAIDSNIDLFRDWFGKPSDDHVAKVTAKAVYNSITSVMSAYTYKLQYYGKYCDQNDYAYTSYKSRTIVFCYKYLNDAGFTGYDTKFGTIIHEMARSASNVTSVGDYNTPAKCKRLAKFKPDKAINNSYNYEYFSESLV